MLYYTSCKEQNLKMNVVCEDFVITETYDRSHYSNVFITDKGYGKYIDMKNTFIFYDHYHLKLNSKNKLSPKQKKLQILNKLMYREYTED